MNAENDILTHVEAGVMTLTLNRLERKNSITSGMYALLADGLDLASGDSTVRAVVIQGHETVFSAGNDIGDFLNQPPAGRESPVFRFLRGIAEFHKPLVAAVCGPAVGIGTTMLFHCDLVYAGDNAAFSTAKPPSSLAETKRLMKQSLQQKVLDQIALEGESFGRLLGEPAAKEAFGAFMEKRKPDFSKL